MIKFITIFLLITNGLAFSISQNRINDDLGRERIFHGTNVVFKLNPWHPSTSEFNYNLSLNDHDIDIIYNLGLNFVRLGVMWPGIEPEKGLYNSTYLSIMKNIVDKLDQKNLQPFYDHIFKNLSSGGFLNDKLFFLNL